MIPYPVLVDTMDECATTRLERDPTFAVQGDDRFPDRDAADAERRGDLVLWHAVTAAECTGDDELTDVPGDAVGGGLGNEVQRAGVGHQRTIGKRGRSVAAIVYMIYNANAE